MKIEEFIKGLVILIVGIFIFTILAQLNNNGGISSSIAVIGIVLMIVGVIAIVYKFINQFLK